MANTFELISSVTVGSPAATISFSSIPASWTDLCIVMSTRTSVASIVDDIDISFNGSTSGFTQKEIYADGINPPSSISYSPTIAITAGANATTSTFGNGMVYIPNYAGSNYKSVSAESVAERSAAESYMGMAALLWSNISAISSITLKPHSAANFAQYSTAYLYGVKNA